MDILEYFPFSSFIYLYLNIKIYWCKTEKLQIIITHLQIHVMIRLGFQSQLRLAFKSQFAQMFSTSIIQLQ